VYAANGHQFWLNLAIASAIAGSAGAVVAALPGFVDAAFGIPRASKAKPTAIAHGACNVVALGLFIATALTYVSHWNGPSASATLGLALSSAGVVLTMVAGVLGSRLMQTYHVGIQLTARQAEDEPVVQQVPTLRVMSHRKAS
jgi:uncharacterized membrane protein